MRRPVFAIIIFACLAMQVPSAKAQDYPGIPGEVVACVKQTIRLEPKDFFQGCSNILLAGGIKICTIEPAPAVEILKRDSATARQIQSLTDGCFSRSVDKFLDFFKSLQAIYCAVSAPVCP